MVTWSTIENLQKQSKQNLKKFKYLYTHNYKILPVHNWEKWTFKKSFYLLFIINMKIEKTRKFWRITAVNGWYRNASWTSEVTELLLDGYKTIGRWKYHWINRPWQRYDYEMALDSALDSLLDRIDWSLYEQLKEDIDEIRKTLWKMKNYDWSNRN